MQETGISNREAPEQEDAERKKFGRPPNTARDRAGHVIEEEPAERFERELDEHVQAPDEDKDKNAR